MIDRQTIQTYWSLREVGKGFHGKVMKGVPKGVLVATAKELGLWKKGVLVTRHKEEIEILTDRFIYDKRWEGKNALEHFEETADVSLTEEEHRYFRAMKSGRFSLFQVVSAYPGSHLTLSDRLTGFCTGEPQPPLEMIDIGMSETAASGLLLALRLLDADGFYMTSGVTFPFSPDDIVDPKDWTAKMPSTRMGIRRIQNGDKEESHERI